MRNLIRFLTPCVMLATAPFLAAQDSTPEEGRIFGMIPNNKTVAQPAALPMPLTPGGKFHLAFRDTVDPFTFVLAGFNAGIAQWKDAFPSFGQGGDAYAKRFGAAYADQAIGNYFTEAFLPTLLREDPRYFRRGTGGKWRRTKYALTRVVVTRTDSGRATFNAAEIFGNAAATGISNLYYPASERTAGESSERLGVQLMSDGAFNVLLEFWPDMRRAFFRK
jgi:hypothetical protein